MIKSYCQRVSNFICYETRERGRACFSPEQFKKIENRVVFSNCVYDVAKDQTYDFSKKLPYSMAVQCKYLSRDIETPYYDKLRRNATGNDLESMEMFDRMIAYLMIPNRSAKCFFLICHAKDSGKTIFGEWICSLFSPSVRFTFDPDFLGSRFSLSGINRSVIATCLETNTNNLTKKAVAQLKTLTGETYVRMEEKYKNQTTTQLRCKLLLASNGGLFLPIGMEDAAFYRRLIVIPFIQSTPLNKIDPNLPRYLQEEKDAIASKAVRSLREHIGKDGGIIFEESALSRSIKESWYTKTNPAENFIREQLEFSPSTNDRLFKDDIYEAYQEYLKTDISEQMRESISVLKRNDLIDQILRTFPGTRSGKARKKDESTPTACLFCIKWRLDEDS